MSKPDVPQFSVKFVDSYYDVQPTTTTTINTYTGEEITTIIPGHIVDSHIEVTIKNQPLPLTPAPNGRAYELTYTVESKGHFGEDWTVWFEATQSASQYTTLSRFIFRSTVGEIDFRVKTNIGYLVDVDYDDSYPWYLFSTTPTRFEIDASSSWSKVQTLTLIGASSPYLSQTEAQPENPSTTSDNNQPQTPEQLQMPDFVFHPLFLLGVGALVGGVVVAVLVFTRRHLKLSDYNNSLLTD